MIWFACKQCGKVHGRPESSSGTLVFCECGHGNLVPWDSTAPEPAAPPLPPMPQPPRLEPVPVGEERRPPPLPSGRSQSPEPYLPRRRQRQRSRDPNFCFNHEHLSAEESCAACKERFCRHCVVRFDGHLVCAPCKNERLRMLARPPKVSGMAVTAMLLSFVAGVLPLCLVPFSASVGSLVVVLLALLPQALGFGLGALALYTTEKNSRLSGRPLAITAMVAAGIGVVLTVGITLYGVMQWV